jgi:uncharacterized protein
MADVRIWVKPGSRKGPLVEAPDDGRDVDLVVYVKERAVDGAANSAVVDALAHHFGVAKSAVEIISGHSARLKRVRLP